MACFWHVMSAMEREEYDELYQCIDCKSPISPETDRAFAVSPEEYLCFDCAVRRGGLYDGDEDRWIRAPFVGDEPDERRPHP
ncbi:MAG: hypothetical protein HYV09_01725 [Deltaproteobacteria bacterium]|nr:hypothetical protein [Deltaproteobacteria bacterium]